MVVIALAEALYRSLWLSKMFLKDEKAWSFQLFIICSVKNCVNFKTNAPFS